jgi:hypothetical protein
MHMIGHEHISVDQTIAVERGLMQPIEVVLVICFVIKTGLPIVTALDYMYGDIG